MSRKIAFRAWDGERMHRTVIVYPDGAVGRGKGSRGWQVLPNAVPMQFTGLTDVKGIEIYEGDLLLTDDMYHDYEGGVAINALPDGKIHTVEYRDGAFFAGGELLCEYASAWEVIGNVYENPELIKAV